MFKSILPTIGSRLYLNRNIYILPSAILIYNLVYQYTLICGSKMINLKLEEKEDIKLFVENIDAWIKQIRSEFSEFKDMPCIVEENVGNIQHNYELAFELKDQVEDLKKELQALKLVQMATLKLKMEEGINKGPTPQS